jgi:hypothetical protein
MKSLNRIFIILLIFLMVGCKSDNPEMIEEIEAAQALWEAQNISNYYLVVQRYRGIEGAQILTMSVVNGQVSDAAQDCGSPAGQGPCTIQEVNPEEYTVEGLFELARDNNHRASILSFDDETGVMTFMSLDDETTVRVEFTPQE